MLLFIELGRLCLCFLIHFRVVSERQVELLPELGRFGVGERMHRAGILDDPIIGFRCTKRLLLALLDRSRHALLLSYN